MCAKIRYSEEDIRKAAARSRSMAEMLRELGLKAAGGNYANMKRKLQKSQIDTSHWTGQAWSKSEQLKDWEKYKLGASIKKILIRKRGHSCQNCHYSVWLGEQIPLEIHHVNGDRTINSEDNLLLLCPNCHALTSSWRGRNKRASVSVRI